MYAPVLTYDKHFPFANHMIHTYQQKWPDNPFIFLVPYNDMYPNELKEKYGDNIELVKSDPSIRATILNLINRFDDEEWIYWAIDDKYLVEINQQVGNELYKWIKTGPELSIDGISFVRARDLLSGKALSGSSKKTNQGMKIHKRKDYSQIWLHQFLKSKVLKYLFKNMPEPNNAKEMDKLKFDVGLPEKHDIYVTNKNYAVLGESTRRGKLTQNCISSLRDYNISIPDDFDVSDDSKEIGDMRRYRNLLFQSDIARSIWWN